MVTTDGARAMARRPPGTALVLSVQVTAAALVAGWCATGHAGAPDDGLQQMDMIMLDERVPGVAAVDGRPTMLVLTCAGARLPPRRLDPAYSLVVSTDAALADRLALPRAAGCEAGHVLVGTDDRVRYRTYDPGWPAHASMDLWLGHIAVHTGPAPLLVALGVVVRGGWSWLAAHAGRARTGAGLAAGALGALVVACLLAAPVPRGLEQFPVGTASVLPG